jgi:hypothetical protein
MAAAIFSRHLEVPAYPVKASNQNGYGAKLIADSLALAVSVSKSRFSKLTQESECGNEVLVSRRSPGLSP